MSASCCENVCASANALSDKRWRRALWIALIVNAAMFAGELVAGAAAGSRSLQADALDFLGDSANYAISLGVAGMAIGWRAKAALLKGSSLALLGSYIFLSTVWAIWSGRTPEAGVMGIVGVLALMVNGGVALMLFRFRSGDANMQSVWICSRNDAIGNIAVVLAAAGVFGTGSAWPDLTVAAIMAMLGLAGGAQIMRQATREIRADRAATCAPGPAATI